MRISIELIDLLHVESFRDVGIEVYIRTVRPMYDALKYVVSSFAKRTCFFPVQSYFRQREKNQTEIVYPLTQHCA